MRFWPTGLAYALARLDRPSHTSGPTLPDQISRAKPAAKGRQPLLHLTVAPPRRHHPSHRLPCLRTRRAHHSLASSALALVPPTRETPLPPRPPLCIACPPGPANRQTLWTGLPLDLSSHTHDGCPSTTEPHAAGIAVPRSQVALFHRAQDNNPLTHPLRTLAAQ